MSSCRQIESGPDSSVNGQDGTARRCQAVIAGLDAGTKLRRSSSVLVEKLTAKHPSRPISAFCYR